MWPCQEHFLAMLDGCLVPSHPAQIPLGIVGEIEVGFPVEGFAWTIYDRVEHGCDGLQFSDAVYDACGVCNGDGLSCAGCDSIPHSASVYDICGVCNGNSMSCLGCDFLPNSGKQYDKCGVCQVCAYAMARTFHCSRDYSINYTLYRAINCVMHMPWSCHLRQFTMATA